jgi:hypothetical protein
VVHSAEVETNKKESFMPQTPAAGSENPSLRTTILRWFDFEAGLEISREDRKEEVDRTPDTSRSNPVIALIALGEGWHNNHPYYAVSARQGFFWWEIDVTYYLLVLLSRLGVVRDLRPLPQSVTEGVRAVMEPARK